MKELELKVNGIECKGCENRIKNTLSELKNIKEVTASHEKGNVRVVSNEEITEEDKNSIIEKLENLGFEVEK